MNLIKIATSILISSLPILLSVVVEPEKYYNNLLFWCLWCVYFILTAFYFYSTEFISYLKFSRNYTNLLLEEFFEKIKLATGIDCVAFIMLPYFNLNPFLGKDKFLETCLFSEYPLELEETLKFNLVRPVKVGIEGIAFHEKNIKVANFEEAREKNHHGWNMHPTDLKLIREFKRGIAVPIEDPQIKGRIIGVLVIYSSDTETPFKDDKFQKFLVGINQLIAILIKGAK